MWIAAAPRWARASRSRFSPARGGIVGVWSALLVLICVRLAALGVRFTRKRWLVTGWA